jgi:hypothetical protein
MLIYRGSVQRLGGLRGHASWRASICPGISAQTRLPEEPNNVSTPNVWTLPSSLAPACDPNSPLEQALQQLSGAIKGRLLLNKDGGMVPAT